METNNLCAVCVAVINRQWNLWKFKKKKIIKRSKTVPEIFMLISNSKFVRNVVCDFPKQGEN